MSQKELYSIYWLERGRNCYLVCVYTVKKLLLFSHQLHQVPTERICTTSITVLVHILTCCEVKISSTHAVRLHWTLAVLPTSLTQIAMYYGGHNSNAFWISVDQVNFQGECINILDLINELWKEIRPANRFQGNLKICLHCPVMPLLERQLELCFAISGSDNCGYRVQKVYPHICMEAWTHAFPDMPVSVTHAIPFYFLLRKINS